MGVSVIELNLNDIDSLDQSLPFDNPWASRDRLNSLSDAWNRLRNDVGGRGLAPVAGVPASLQTRVNNKWVDWRKFFEEASDTTYLPFTDTFEEFLRNLNYWQNEYDALYNELQQSKIATPTAPAPWSLPQEPGVVKTKVIIPPEEASKLTGPIKVMIFVGGAIAIGLAFLYFKRRRAFAGFGDPWEHVGGGCMIGSDEEFPCDDDYEDEATGRIVNISTTKERHFTLPEHVDSLDDVLRLSGVDASFVRTGPTR